MKDEFWEQFWQENLKQEFEQGFSEFTNGFLSVKLNRTVKNRVYALVFVTNLNKCVGSFWLHDYSISNRPDDERANFEVEKILQEYIFKFFARNFKSYTQLNLDYLNPSN